MTTAVVSTEVSRVCQELVFSEASDALLTPFPFVHV